VIGHEVEEGAEEAAHRLGQMTGLRRDSAAQPPRLEAEAKHEAEPVTVDGVDVSHLADNAAPPFPEVGEDAPLVDEASWPSPDASPTDRLRPNDDFDVMTPPGVAPERHPEPSARDASPALTPAASSRGPEEHGQRVAQALIGKDLTEYLRRTGTPSTNLRAFAREAVVGFAVRLLTGPAVGKVTQGDVSLERTVDVDADVEFEFLPFRFSNSVDADFVDAVIALDLSLAEVLITDKSGDVLRYNFADVRFDRIDTSFVHMRTMTSDFWVGEEKVLRFYAANAAEDFCVCFALLSDEANVAGLGVDAGSDELSPEDMATLAQYGVSIAGIPELEKLQEAANASNFDVEPRPEPTVKEMLTGGEWDYEAEAETEGTFFTFSYMVWGILVCLDFPMSFFALLLSDQPDLALFSQALCLLFQCTLLGWFKPFDPVGVNYFAIVAGTIEFLIASTGGFLALFSKYVNTPLGEAYQQYIPALEQTASVFTLAILFWSFGLVFGKIVTNIVETTRTELEAQQAEADEKAALEEAAEAEEAGKVPA
jgi:hypothetical protein